MNSKVIWILVAIATLGGLWWFYSKRTGSSTLSSLAKLGGVQRSDGSLLIPKSIYGAGYTPAGYHRAFNESDIGIDPSVDVWAPDSPQSTIGTWTQSSQDRKFN